ncbi:hypothetical protein A9G29_12375 [Gilliamella sp. Fer2-1]|nr:hypothetical protein A9G29_12375 [Gilliamella apicola]
MYVAYKTASWLSTDNFIARIGGPWQKCQHADVNMIINRNEKGNNIDYGHADAYPMFYFTRIKDEVIQL